MSGEDRIIGIDLGTTNSVVSVVVGSEPEVIPNTEGVNKTPSVVAFMEDGEVVVGEIARRQAATNPLRTISSVKRIMGRNLDDIEESGERFAFRLVSHEGELLIDIDGMGYRPEQISALILKKLKESAEAYLGEEIAKAVITVPAYFDDMQRQATIEAAGMAGLEVLRLINEPTAAAMAYGLGRSGGGDEVVAVYDFGGGTFDITILEITGKTFEVLTSTGDTRLGGDDLDAALVAMICEEFSQKHGVDLAQDPVTLRRLTEVAERTKCELSTLNQAGLSLPFIAYQEGQPLHLERIIQREEFEDLIDELVRRTVRCCKKALEEAGMKKKDIARVIMVGGSTRIPLVQDSVEEFFGLEGFRGVNPDEVVALGAATQAGVFEGNIQEVILLDVTPHSLGIEVEGGSVSRIIEKNSTIPIKAAKTFTTTEDNQEFVNIHVLQGENQEAAENRSLGKFMLTGVDPAQAGSPRIRVTFFINADGVMEISAEDMNSGKSEGITIVHSQLSEEEQSKRKRRRSRRRRRSGAAGSGTSAGGGRGGGKRSGDDSKVSAVVIPGPGGMPLPSGSTPKPADDSDIRESQKFSVLGDTQPGDVHREQIVRARELPSPEKALSPVDYSKAPPTYSHMAAPPASPPSGEIPPPPPPKSGTATQESFHETPTVMQGKESPDRATPFNAQDTVVSGMPYTGDNETSGAGIELPPDVEAAVAKAKSGEDDTAAQDSYVAALNTLRTPPLGDSQSFVVLEARVWLHSYAGQAEEARQVLGIVREKYGTKRPGEILPLHEAAYNRFGTASMLRERGMAREATGDLQGACHDIELAMKQEPLSSDKDYLEALYRRRMHHSEDPQAQFKLVKILLKNNEVDEAIEILEVLQRDGNYEARALKVLGLCYWQKNMHYLAWQKFRELPVDDDMRDILYRLAADMETVDQLHNAVSVLEHVLKDTPQYRDADARLRKIKYRLKLQQDENESQRSVPVLGPSSRFVIEEEINRGSMGIIYRARDKTLNDLVALKILNDYLCSDPMAVERFKTEARAAKKLSHPYIVRIHDFFEIESKRCISMEFIEGIDMKRLFNERTTFTEEMILYYFMQICDALGYAHKLGIVHRDIKPANIMVTSQNAVKITDFGIAKMLQSADATKSGTAVIGTPLYMAPEQIIGDKIDGRTDIYALGIMLYEMVSGNPPFYLGNIEYHHIHTAPPPLPDRVAENLQNVILKMIAKKPEDRFQTVEEIVPAIRQNT